MFKLIILKILLFTVVISNADQGFVTDYIRMNPTTLPSTCRTGDIRVQTGSTPLQLQLCNSNAWGSITPGQWITSGNNIYYLLGNVGIGTSSPSTDLAFGGAAARTVGMERANSGAGNSFTVSSGGAQSGGTDLAGGSLVLRSGLSTGTGASNILFQTYTPASASGSSDNSVSNKMALSGGGFLGIGTTTPIARIHTSGNISAAAWTSSGIGLKLGTATYTDTTSTGSPSITVHTIDAPTVAASNSITPSALTTLFVSAPTDGSNVVTATNSLYSIRATGNTRFSGMNLFGTNSGAPSSVLGIDGNRSDTSWSTVGKLLGIQNVTLTDTSGSGTIATRVGNSFGNVTLASSSAVTVTNAANVYISNASSGGTNTTITNASGLLIASGAIANTTNGYGLTVNAPTGATNNYGASFTGNVGMGGVTDPMAPLSIAAQGVTVGTNEQISLRSQRVALVSGNMQGGISFRSNDTQETAPGVITALFGAIAENTLSSTTRDTGLYFTTTLGTTLSEKMRLTAAGNLGIGVTSPGSALDVKGTLRLSGATSGFVGFAPAAAAGSTTYTLPTADGTSNQILSTNGSGTLSWVSSGSAAPTPPTAVKTANYTVLTGDGTVLGDSSGGAFTFTLFTPVGNSGRIVTLKKTDTSLNAIAISGTGLTSQNLSTLEETVSVQSDGTNWSVLTRNYSKIPTSYTPTFTSLGTVAATAFWWLRDGKYMRVFGTVTTGTPTATLWSMTIPSGATMDTTYLSPSGNTTANPGMMVGRAQAQGTNGYYNIVTAPGTSTSIVYDANVLSGSTPLTPQSTNTGVPTGGLMSIDFTIPISGWNP